MVQLRNRLRNCQLCKSRSTVKCAFADTDYMIRHNKFALTSSGIFQQPGAGFVIQHSIDAAVFLIFRRYRIFCHIRAAIQRDFYNFVCFRCHGYRSNLSSRAADQLFLILCVNKAIQGTKCAVLGIHTEGSQTMSLIQCTWRYLAQCLWQRKFALFQGWTSHQFRQILSIEHTIDACQLRMLRTYNESFRFDMQRPKPHPPGASFQTIRQGN